jgi:hypothetical protein
MTVYQGRPVDHVTTQLDGIYRRALGLGIRVVAGSIVPYNTATADQNARMHAINDWIKDRGRSRERRPLGRHAPGGSRAGQYRSTGVVGPTSCTLT